ncbi:MAG: acetyl-CoA carboxylase carboxyl transferase subunit beta [Rickettsiales bacterium]|nr:acetyl-CoA carboxylase carboxyl transferase subunit beta [Rickettsiales bacterium]|tara:strand:+ start:23520 stop:24377 length:858 start_codon:yes stop_codon:yes gene_type:complete
MNWISNYVRPKLRALVGAKNETPENLWTKCPKCEQMLFMRDLERNHYVCTNCDHHLRMSAEQRLKFLFDEGQYKEIDLPEAQNDPLKFKDTKRYSDRLKTYRDKTKNMDAVRIATGTISDEKLVVCAFDFNFMGGSMGIVVGESIVRAAEEALRIKKPLLIITASGGARMQEGAFSLMQMPKSMVAVEMMKNAGLPYLVLLTDPTTGGVSASFAMAGDIAIAEPEAMIGFAGRRVIEETIREKLPDNFQTAEHLLEHGMIDMVVHRHELRAKLSRILRLLNQRHA